MNKQAVPTQSLASELTSLQSDLLSLLDAEKHLVRHEMNTKIRELVRATPLVVFGVVFAGLVFLGLVAAGILALSLVVEPWAAALITAGALGVIGAVLLLQIKRFEPMPRHTVTNIERDVQAIRHAVTGADRKDVARINEPPARPSGSDPQNKNSLLREIWETIKETGSDWSDDNASQLAAALAYYALLSLAPLLVIAVAFAGFFFGTDAARGKVAAELGGIVGGEAAQSIQTVVSAAESPAKGIFGTIAGVVTLFFGASGVFGELQASMNTVWEVKPKPGGGLWREVRRRFFSFSMVLGVAFLLLVSLVVSSLLSSIGAFFEGFLPGGEALWQVLNFVISLGVVVVLFSVIFKYLPDAKIRWADVWVGGAVTAVLFTIGKFALGLYLGKAAVGSAYGAAGSIIALVVWVYYATQIFLLGAEFTQVRARRRGRQIEPSNDAVATSQERVSAASAPSADHA